MTVRKLVAVLVSGCSKQNHPPTKYIQIHPTWMSFMMAPSVGKGRQSVQTWHFRGTSQLLGKNLAGGNAHSAYMNQSKEKTQCAESLQHSVAVAVVTACLQSNNLSGIVLQILEAISTVWNWLAFRATEFVGLHMVALLFIAWLTSA